MKKLLLLPILFLVLVSCYKSNTDEVQTNTIPAQLIGTWKYTGNYDDNGNEPNGSNFHPYTLNFLITFNSDGTFVSNSDGVIINGTFGVNSSNVLLCNYNPVAGSMPITIASLKMYTFTNSAIEFYDSNATLGSLTGVFRFEKVTAKN